MGIAKIVGKIATHDDLVVLLIEMEKEQIKLRSAIEWALGENGEFSEPVRHESERPKPFWWRKELRERAGLDT